MTLNLVSYGSVLFLYDFQEVIHHGLQEFWFKKEPEENFQRLEERLQEKRLQEVTAFQQVSLCRWVP